MKKVALIFAGGKGSRMNSEDLPKQFIEVNGKPIIVHTLEYFQKNEQIDEICVVCINDYIDYCCDLVNKFKLNKVKYIIPGGKTGQDSIYNGLVKISENNDSNSIVLIHDGVRPLINQRIIDDAIKYTQKHRIAIPCVPCTETIVKVNDNQVIDVPKRKESFVAQAPQAFVLGDILSAHNEIRKINENYENVIDSCTLYYMLGRKIYIYDGLDENIKITTRKDLYLLDALLKYKNNECEENVSE